MGLHGWVGLYECLWVRTRVGRAGQQTQAVEGFIEQGQLEPRDNGMTQTCGVESQHGDRYRITADLGQCIYDYFHEVPDPARNDFLLILTSSANH